ncbi:peptidoglycan-binding protein [Sphingomonas sp. AP4-R1]|uniref:peptidoglycan-binding protein n=1 Tax=Sphingomonas sp. AP4-R1 TaxID=2735134 RepID=UPI001493AA10|nr:peptidoglycan-binding protein [Sphingomonas sp. AP4-R1]QJU57423.1 peptidoglycan-binding protein [Sphingomonas sp. AP4-R1]
MVYTAAFRSLPPAQRADLLYRQARDDMAQSLWSATIGGGPSGDGKAAAAPVPRARDMDLNTMLAILTQPQAAADAARVPAPDARALLMPQPPAAWPERSDDPPPQRQPRPSAPVAGLGPNAGYRDTLSAAAARTGFPAEALAAIINAEAAQNADGSWISHSRNTRSSAAGLGQFLSGTWKGMAERRGSWLNAFAEAQGWLDPRGHVRGEAKSDLLALRYDARASIETIADYAHDNVATMRAAGLAIGASAESVGQAAYLAHHLGVSDAIRFVKRGLDPARAETLLAAQIGSAAASARIAQCGDAAQAHRSWLIDYTTRQFRPGRFAAAFHA